MKNMSFGNVIFAKSYLDFVRLQSFLDEQNVSFIGISEYSNDVDVARSISLFADRRKKILLYTERAHFYNRFKFKE